MKKNLLNLKEVYYEVNSNLVLEDINLDIDEGNFVSIIGKSGSGKTTLLKIISGLKKQTKGTVILNDKILSNDGIFVEPEDRKLGLVVQEKVLFPHLNVQDNVQFGIASDDKKNEKCIEMLKKFHISDLIDKYPHEISGGEAQRVALARTLVTKPSVLLLDEPFNGLDQGLKDEIYPDIKRILKENKMTTIMVSHDLNEVKSLSNKIYELNNATLRKYES